jgi:hypothetical protein
VKEKYLRKTSTCKKGRWEDKIKMDFRKNGCQEGKWMELAQDRVQWLVLVLAVLKLRVLLPEC